MTDEELEALVERISKKVVQDLTHDIAERAAARAIQILAAEVGTSVVKKLGWLIGLGVLGLLAWLGAHGNLPSGGG
jgi:hypothetical protein